MSKNNNISEITFMDNKKSIILLIVAILSITIIYQSRPFLDDNQFSYIAVPAFTIGPGLVTVYSSILAVKLYKQKNYQAKGFALFAVGAAFWMIAEQIWQLYDHIWEGDPFPSEADIFYLGAYPLMTAFLFLSLRPVLKKVNRNVVING